MDAITPSKVPRFRRVFSPGFWMVFGGVLLLFIAANVASGIHDWRSGIEIRAGFPVEFTHLKLRGLIWFPGFLMDLGVALIVSALVGGIFGRGFNSGARTFHIDVRTL